MSIARALLACMVVAIASIATRSSSAHELSDSYLVLQESGERISGHWDVSLRDLDQALRIDRDEDGRLTWGEVRASRTEIERFALERLWLRRAGEPCAVTSSGALQLDRHGGETHVVLPIEAQCAAGDAELQLGYDLLFDLDRSHRGIVKWVSGEGSESVQIARPDARELRFAPSAGPLFPHFFAEGVAHILDGTDHMLFLLVLVLAVVSQSAVQASMGPAVRETLKILTSFTVAHAVTLSAAQLGLLQVPSRWVESLIALSIVLTAVDNLRPFLGSRRWVLAFVFGLVHGLGFASALGPLSLSSLDLAISLAAFNLGIEAGQVALAALTLLVFGLVLRQAPARSRAVAAGSIAAACVGLGWLIDRALALQAMPF